MVNILNRTIKPNQKQQECIDSIQGKYLVLAGPGTGKTFTIIERIKNMIKKGIEPEKILCLTFTDAAANEMKLRIENELHIASLGIQIYTYHAFACSIIDEFIDEFEIPLNYKVISDAVSKALIKECIDEINPTYFRTEKNDPYFYINTIKNKLSAIKQNRLTKETYFNNIANNPDWEPEKNKLEQKIKEKQNKGDTRTKTDEANLKSITKKINQAKELWIIFELYSKKMYDARYLDFNDMINLVLDKFDQDNGFLDKIANRYHYIMVDEYQDTNKSQNQIVFTLGRALHSENLFVVGDDCQIIYRFQGAKLETLSNFLAEFPDTKVICLTENMRSTQNILDAAKAVIDQDPLNLENNSQFKKYNIDKNLIAKNPEIISKSKPVRLYKYADIMQEYTEIVNEIEELINSEECPINNINKQKNYSQIAVLTRSNAEAIEFSEIFKQKNIPYELKDGRDIFSIPAVNVLYFYIQFLINPNLYSHRIYQLLLAKPFSINPFDYNILHNNISKEKNFIDVLRTIDFSELKEPQKLQDFLETYDYLSEYKTKENIKNTILEIGAKTGIFNYYLNTEINKTESIAGIKCFLDEAVGFSEIYKTSFLEEFNTYLDAIIADDESITTEKAPVNMNAVQLCTYHSSKGREFEYVYMPTLVSDKWESSSKSVKSEIPLDISEYKTSDELKSVIKPSDMAKLLYVAMTRAKHTLRMSYPERINGKIKRPTKFLSTIIDIFEREETPFEYNEVTYWEQAKNLLDKRNYDYRLDFKEFINSKISDREFSITAINRYLSCPRQYLYNDIFDMQTRAGNPNSLSYGSAIHKSLEFAYGYFKTNSIPPNKEDVISRFKEELSKLPMDSFQQRQNFEGRGEIAISNYYPHIINTLPSMIYEQEFKLKYTFEDGTKFIGFIDRIDKNSDGTFSIYDYKTGNNKNYLITPEGEHSDYYNQIAMYKYIYEHQTGNVVTQTKFLYPEDYESKNNGIEFTDEDIKEVVDKFKSAVDNIRLCNFEPTYDRNACKYCNYHDFCEMNII